MNLGSWAPAPQQFGPLPRASWAPALHPRQMAPLPQPRSGPLRLLPPPGALATYSLFIACAAERTPPKSQAVEPQLPPPQELPQEEAREAPAGGQGSRLPPRAAQAQAQGRGWCCIDGVRQLSISNQVCVEAGLVLQRGEEACTGHVLIPRFTEEGGSEP